MLLWQIKRWWSNLLMEMLFKVAFQFAACAILGSFDADFGMGIFLPTHCKMKTSLGFGLLKG